MIQLALNQGPLMSSLCVIQVFISPHISKDIISFILILYTGGWGSSRGGKTASISYVADRRSSTLNALSHLILREEWWGEY